MENKMEERGFYAWIVRHVHAPYARQLFFVLFALEAILLVPLDPILAFFATHRRHEAYRLAALATIGSVVGALIGYVLGNILWDIVGKQIIALLVKQSTFDAFVVYYQQHFKTALFLGALLPFPFKVLTISAGFCDLPLGVFCAVIAFARAIRFFVICYVSTEWGSVIKAFVKQYSRHILLLLAIKIALVLVCYMVFFR